MNSSPRTVVETCLIFATAYIETTIFEGLTVQSAYGTYVSFADAQNAHDTIYTALAWDAFLRLEQGLGHDFTKIKKLLLNLDEGFHVSGNLHFLSPCNGFLERHRQGGFCHHLGISFCIYDVSYCPRGLRHKFAFSGVDSVGLWSGLGHILR